MNNGGGISGTGLWDRRWCCPVVLHPVEYTSLSYRVGVDCLQISNSEQLVEHIFLFKYDCQSCKWQAKIWFLDAVEYTTQSVCC